MGSHHSSRGDGEGARSARREWNHSGNCRGGLDPAELREIERRSGATDAAHGGNARGSRRRAARLREFRYRREGNSSGRRQLAAPLFFAPTATRTRLDIDATPAAKNTIARLGAALN